MLTLVVLEGLVLVLLGVLVVGLLRSHAEILRRLHELGAGVFDDETTEGGLTSEVELSDRPQIRTQEGVPQPRAANPQAGDPRADNSAEGHDVAGVTPQGNAKAVGVVGTAHSTLLAFLSSGCGTCGDFWRAFAAGEADSLPGRDTRLVIVTRSPEDESISAVRELARDAVVTVMSSQAFDDYGVPVSPYFILVDGPTGSVVGEGAAGNWSQVANLLRQAAADAGLSTDGSPRAAGARMGRGDDREARADADLLAAGIGPGHPSLYPEPGRDDES